MGRRLWLFRGIALVAVPAIVLAVLELGLRIGGYGFPPGATTACRVGGVLCRADNVKFGWRFFPRNIAQEFDPFVFPAVKPPGTYRIFVLGASAAQGTPDPAYSFGRILEVMLDHANPQVDFEVTIAAMPAINSHVVVEIARDLARYGPDLFVVYLGNNEVVGPYGPGTVLSPLSPSLALIRAGIRLRATRTGQLLADVAARIRPRARTPKVWRGLEMFVDHQVAAIDPRLESVYDHFRKNLQDVRSIAVASGAHVTLCTVGSNLRDCAPFASLHRPDLSEADAAEWDQLYGEAVSREQQRDLTGAIEGYAAAAQIDDRFADLHFRLGRCHWLTGAREEAANHFVLARDLDALRFRPDRRINQIIREVATQHEDARVHLLDAEELFRSHSPSGVPGRELFHEHVHLNFHGNYLLARAIFEMTESIRTAASGPPAVAPSEMLCMERLAYNQWAHYNVLYKVLHYYLQEPPFTSQLYHAEQVASLAGQVTSLEAGLTPSVRAQIAAQYAERIAQKPTDLWLRLRYAEFSSVQMRDNETAVEQCRRVQALVPHSYKPHLLAALALGQTGRLTEAITHLDNVVRIKPTCGQAYHLLGLVHQAQRRIPEAMRCYTRAVYLSPDNFEAYKKMSDILHAQGKTRQAREMLLKASSASANRAVPSDRSGSGPEP